MGSNGTLPLARIEQNALQVQIGNLYETDIAARRIASKQYIIWEFTRARRHGHRTSCAPEPYNHGNVEISPSTIRLEPSDKTGSECVNEPQEISRAEHAALDHDHEGRLMFELAFNSLSNQKRKRKREAGDNKSKASKKPKAAESISVPAMAQLPKPSEDQVFTETDVQNSSGLT